MQKYSPAEENTLTGGTESILSPSSSSMSETEHARTHLVLMPLVVMVGSVSAVGASGRRRRQREGVR